MDSSNLQTVGRIVSVQRCSIHDGPGVRTTVFVKGCQLNCAWCHNPESISFEKEEFYYPDKCIGCGKCAEGCFAGARVKCGEDVSVAQVMRDVNEDRPYYGDEGGITISGGEPLCQPAFTMAILDACRAAGIKTAMESNLCVPARVLEPFLGKLDLLMADCKFWSPQLHEKWTGHTNELTKQNFSSASDAGIPIIMRTPVIPGVNADPDEIRAVARFAASLPTLMYYELLTYHPLGVSKAIALGQKQTRFESPSPELMHTLASIASDEGVRVLINSKPYENI